MLKYFLHLLIIVSIVDIVTGCMCIYQEESDRYCEADFALIVRVKGTGTIINNGNERRYKIETIRNLKPEVPDDTVIDDKIFTGTNSCGALLERDIYLIAGDYRDNGYGEQMQYIRFCKSIFRKLTEDEAEAYEKPECNSPASIVQVKGKGNIIKNEKVYNTKTIKNLKPEVQEKTVIGGKVYTAKTTAECGVELKQNAIYLIAGMYRDSKSGKKKQYIRQCLDISRKLTEAEAKAYTPPVCS